MRRKLEYFVWRVQDPLEGWINRRVFELESGRVIGVAPGGVWTEALAQKDFELAVDLSFSCPERNRLVLVGQAEASVLILEVGIEHQKSLCQLAFPGGTYFVLWTEEFPEKGDDGFEEAAYGRVIREASDGLREIVVLGVQKSRTGLLDAGLRTLKGARILRPADLEPGKIYLLDFSTLIPCSKAEIRALRLVEKGAWVHHPDLELDPEPEPAAGKRS